MLDKFLNRERDFYLKEIKKQQRKLNKMKLKEKSETRLMGIELMLEELIGIKENEDFELFLKKSRKYFQVKKFLKHRENIREELLENADYLELLDNGFITSRENEEIIDLAAEKLLIQLKKTSFSEGMLNMIIAIPNEENLEKPYIKECEYNEFGKGIEIITAKLKIE